LEAVRRRMRRIYFELVRFSLSPVPAHNPVTSDDDAKAEPLGPAECQRALRSSALFEASAHRYFP
jgi:hypothetical protein